MRRELTPCRSDVTMLASVALAKLALHLVLSGRYGLLDRRSLIAVNIPEE